MKGKIAVILLPLLAISFLIFSRPVFAWFDCGGNADACLTEGCPEGESCVKECEGHYCCCSPDPPPPVCECSGTGSETVPCVGWQCGSQTRSCDGCNWSSWDTSACRNYYQWNKCDNSCGHACCTYTASSCDESGSNECSTDGDCCSSTSPDSPSLISPADGITITSPSTILSWNALANWGTNCSGNNNQYRVYLGTAANPPYVASVNSSTVQYNTGNLTSRGWYYWKICATNGYAEGCSVVRSFYYPQDARIWGYVYLNSTTTSCNSGAYPSKTVTIKQIDDSYFSDCPLTINTAVGTYDSDNCPTKPKQGRRYNVSVNKTATETCTLASSCGGSSCSQNILATASIQQNFTIFPVRVAWYQTGYGDVHVNTSVSSAIPDTCSGTCSPYLSLGGAPPAISPGVVSSFGSISPSANMSPAGFNWQVRDNSEELRGFGDNDTSYKYAWFKDNIQNCVTEDKENFFNPGHFKDLGLDPGGNCYIFTPGDAGTSYKGSVRTVVGDEDPAKRQKIIILVDGNITFNPRIQVNSGGFFALVSSGDITFDTGIGSSTPLNPSASESFQMQGIYIADGSINFGNSANQFLGGGMFIADADLLGTGSLNLNRNLDLGGASNNNTSFPSEYFEYRPDFLVNFPVNFGVNKFTWQEVAP